MTLECYANTSEFGKHDITLPYTRDARRNADSEIYLGEVAHLR